MSDRTAGTLAALWWPLDRLGDGVRALALHGGWLPADTAPLDAPPPGLHADHALATRWLDWAATRLGVEVEPVQVPVNHVDDLLARAGPALLPLADPERGMGFVLLAGRRGGRCELIDPAQRVRRVPMAALRDALAGDHEARWRSAIESLLDDAKVRGRRRTTAHAALLRERLEGEQLAPWWLLRLPATAPLPVQARAARLPRTLLALLAAGAVLYVSEALAWALLGRGILDGRLDDGWLWAWALVLLGLLALQIGLQRLDDRFGRGVAALLKGRLLAGALRADPDAVRASGVGAVQGRALEAQALESLVVGGVVGTAIALIEIAVAAGVLALGATPLPHLALLAGWLALTALLCGLLARRQAGWTTARLTLTQRLIEQMVGHRTRLAQERPARRDAEEDQALGAYHQASLAMDRAALPVRALLPSLWIVLALGVLALAFVEGAGARGGAGAAALAVSLGGILLAQRGGLSLTAGLVTLGRAWQAWGRVAELVRLGRARPDEAPPVFVDAAPRADAATAVVPDAGVLQARALGFAHTRTRPLIETADLRIGAGQKLLLQGPSGGGKSTLAALLAGLRAPRSGLLLLQGLDRASLGAQWQGLVTLAPQFHENHVFAGTLAFNLLLGRGGVEDAAALAEARAVCEELGLGELIERMPAGLQQRIGETGWQLSHGERGRLFLARALLQRAPLTILDECFAALDPQTLGRCLAAVQQRTDALLVIAHP